MNETQKAKKKFRQSKEWKIFRKLMFSKSGKIDYITQKPLRKGWQLHHLNLDETQYADLREEGFICINRQTHETIHWLFRYFQKDPAVIQRLQKIMQKMAEINIDKK